MIPVRTGRSNFVYRGPTPDIGDAWVRRAPSKRAVYLVWQPSEAERRAIAEGGLIELGIFNMEPIPPVSLNIATEQVLDEAGVALSDRARAHLRVRYGYQPVPAGHWAVSQQVWAQLQEHRVLDNAPGDIPTLWGRPLIAFDEESDRLEYVEAP